MGFKIIEEREWEINRSESLIVINRELRLVATVLLGAKLERLFWCFLGFLARILIEHIESICRADSTLNFVSMCSIRIRSKTRDIPELTAWHRARCF